MSGPGVIQEEPMQRCEMCGVIDETRPYGPNGEQICFECGMKDEETTRKQMAKYIFGEQDGNSSKA
jgi:hypothetical protein